MTGGQSSLQFPAFIGACPQLRMGNLTTYANIVEFGGEVSMQTLISKYLPLMSEWSIHSLMLGLTDLHMIYVRKFNYVIKSDGYKMSHTMVRKTPLLDPMYMQRTMAPVIVDYDRSLSLDDFSMETEDHPCKLHQFHRMANRSLIVIVYIYIHIYI